MPIQPPGSGLPPAKAPPRKPDPTSPSDDDQKRFEEALGAGTSNGLANGLASPLGGQAPADARPNFSGLPNSGGGSDNARTDEVGSLFRRRDSSHPKRESDTPPQPTADQILRNLGGNPQAADQVEPAEPEAPHSSLSDMVNEVADRLMVGQSGPAGQQEVRIQLKQDVLSGTEVRVSENQGTIGITFVAANKDVETFLGGRQQEIATALGERLNREVRVEITDNSGASRDNDGGGRERGGQGGGERGGQGGGQSRDGGQGSRGGQES